MLSRLHQVGQAAWSDLWEALGDVSSLTFTRKSTCETPKSRGAESPPSFAAGMGPSGYVTQAFHFTDETETGDQHLAQGHAVDKSQP